MNSLATRFMPSISGVTSAISAKAYNAHRSTKGIEPWMKWIGLLSNVAYVQAQWRDPNSLLNCLERMIRTACRGADFL
jgi:hypothetical protein